MTKVNPSRVRMRARLGVVAVAALSPVLLAPVADSVMPTSPDPVPQRDFRVIVLSPNLAQPTESPQDGSGRPIAPSVIYEPASPPVPEQRRTHEVAQPEAKAEVIVKPDAVRPAGHVITGRATWYCCTHGLDGLVAAAGPVLRRSIPHWRGRVVTLTANGHRIAVRLGDWCGCGGGRTLIDLQPAVLRALHLSPSDGVYRVTVAW